MTASATPASPALHPAVPAIPMTTLVKVELRKLVDTRAGRWLLIIAALILVAAMVVVVSAGNPEDRSFSTLLAISQFPAAVILPILGILATTGEWSQRTALTTFALVPKRERVIASKILAALVLGLIAIAFTTVAAAITALIAPAFGETQSDWSVGLGDYLQLVLFLLLNMLVGVAFGMAFLNTAVAIVSYFAIPMVVGALSAAITALGDNQAWFDTSISWNFLIDPDAGAITGEVTAQIIVSSLLWIGLPLAIGAARVLRKEIH